MTKEEFTEIMNKRHVSVETVIFSDNARIAYRMSMMAMKIDTYPRKMIATQTNDLFIGLQELLDFEQIEVDKLGNKSA